MAWNNKNDSADIALMKRVLAWYPDVCYCRDNITQYVMVFPSRRAMGMIIGRGTTVRAAFRQVGEYIEYRKDKMV